MPARIIDGVGAAARTKLKCKERVRALASVGIVPGLAMIVVGSDPASAVYVRNKIRACEDVGVRSYRFEFPVTAGPEEVLDLIAELNERRDVHGILVQLPLPAHFDVPTVLKAIPIRKDVDGFHLYNVGGLVVGDVVFPPCTPFGVMRLLQDEGVILAGKNAVVVGASNIVGKPMALMLMREGATVTVCHALTRNLALFTILAEVLIVAVGKPNLITGEMIRDDAIVIDVGINRLPSGQIVGDVDYLAVRERASLLTPVPGGVGPMTVAMLLENTVRSAEAAVDSLPVF